MDFDKQKREQRIKNKSRKDANRYDRQINREKIKSKAYRPRLVYNLSDEEDLENEWDDWEDDLS